MCKKNKLKGRNQPRRRARVASYYVQVRIYWVTQKLPQIYTATHATFPIWIRKIQICGNFRVTQYFRWPVLFVIDNWKWNSKRLQYMTLCAFKFTGQIKSEVYLHTKIFFVLLYKNFWINFICRNLSYYPIYLWIEVSIKKKKIVRYSSLYIRKTSFIVIENKIMYCWSLCCLILKPVQV